MKKIGIAIVIILLLIIGSFLIYRFILSITPDDGSALQAKIDYFNNQVDIALLIYGEDIKFPEGLEYEKIDSLDPANWQRDNDYVYLIISDLNGSTTFEKEEYLELVEYADVNTNFNFYYIGTDSLDMISKNTKDCNLDDSDMSFGYIINEGNRLIHYGVWSKNDHQHLENNPTLLGSHIYEMVIMHVKSNER